MPQRLRRHVRLPFCAYVVCASDWCHPQSCHQGLRAALCEMRLSRADSYDPGLPRHFSGGQCGGPCQACSLGNPVRILEDNALMAACVVLALDAEGHDTFLASTIASAAEAVSAITFDVAMLDIEVGKELSWGFAHHLMDIGLRFFFTSARDPTLLPEAFAQKPYLQKPYEMDRLIRILKELKSA